jgi:hypothetical protein
MNEKEVPLPEPKPENVPLTLEQKLAVMSIQRKQLMNEKNITALEKANVVLDQQLQSVLNSIIITNNIDPMKMRLSDDLDIEPIPVQK